MSRACAIAVMAGLYSCSGGGGGGGALPPAEIAPEYMVYSNVNDPRIARATTASGVVVEYYGSKDVLGIATSISAVSVTDMAGTSTIELGGDDLPERIYTSNGSRFDLTWDLLNSSVHIVGTSPSGEYAIAAEASLTPQMMPLVSSSVGTSVGRATAGNREVEIQALVGEVPEGVVSTSITHCGLPASNLQVRTFMRDASNDEYIGAFPSLDQGNGVFETTVPLGQTYISSSLETCQQLAGALGQTCTLFNLFGPTASTTLCVAFSVALDAATIPTGEAVALSAACFRLTATLDLACGTLSGSAAPGTPDLASVLCNANFDAPGASQVSFQTCVIALPSNICSSVSTSSAATPVVVENAINLGDPHVSSLSVAPQAPVSGESFTAIAEVYCIPAGSNVILSVMGSDGFFDDRVHPFPAPALNEQFSLVVPGAAEGVQETVKVTVNPPTGDPISVTLIVTIGANPDALDAVIPSMVTIPSGSFTMGSDEDEAGPPYYPNLQPPAPAHSVTISEDFKMSRTEITQYQYQSLMGTNPSGNLGALNPVERVSWYDARAYCAALTSQERAKGNIPADLQYRLPTEAEWEYACRAGTSSEFNTGPELECSDANIWQSIQLAPGEPVSFDECEPVSTNAVGSYAPNGHGLYDMHGNVYEWCLDAFADYSTAGATDPLITQGENRVLRSSSWLKNSYSARSSSRSATTPGITAVEFGFRIVLGEILIP